MEISKLQDLLEKMRATERSYRDMEKTLIKLSNNHEDNKIGVVKVWDSKMGRGIIESDGVSYSVMYYMILGQRHRNLYEGQRVKFIPNEEGHALFVRKGGRDNS